MERDLRFDIAKGIAMLLVIWGHTSIIGRNFIYSFHMPVFFIISGYFFRKRETKFVISNGIRRLIVPYIITCAIAAIIRIIHGWGLRGLILPALWGTGSSVNTAHYFSNIPNIGPIWFLLGLFWSWLALHFIIKIKNQTIVITIIATVFLLSTLLGRFVLVAPFSILSGLCALPFIYFGYYAKGKIFSRTAITLLLVIWVGGFFFSEVNIARCYFKSYYIDILSGIGGYIALLALSSYLQRVRIVAKVLSFIGRNSIVYLCFHYILHVYFHYKINDVLFFMLQVIVVTIIVILLSYIKPSKEIFKISLK